MNSQASDIETRAELLLPEMAALIATALNLDVAPGKINPDSPLYGGELSLDSIDVLEIALAVSKKYKVQLKAGDQDNTKIFASLRSLARYVAEKQGAA